MASMHNVRLDGAMATAERSKTDPTAAQLKAEVAGEWRVDASKPQFGATVKFPKGETLFEADFPPLMSGDGRAPSPLVYCFYGALSCYASTYAMQAAMAGVPIRSLKARLRVTVDFRPALGIADVPPFDAFRFELDVDTDASADEVARIKALADARCPAVWAMENRVEHHAEVRKV